MSNQYGFEGRVALVTGGASGIGAAAVERLQALDLWLDAQQASKLGLERRPAVGQAEADGTVFISTPHHCAVGIKPPVTVA